MCVLIHKPAGAAIPRDLLTAAARLNSDGWGLMGFDAGGKLLLKRHATVDVEELFEVEGRLRDAEYALHLRRRTRGRVDLDNTHPIEIDAGLYLMHNGTLPYRGGYAGHSDTRNFAHLLLRPLARRYAGLLGDRDFQTLFELGLAASNKLVLFDYPHRRFDILNRSHGVEFEGLWLSSARWVDRSVLPLTQTRETQERTFHAREVNFL